VTSDKWQVTSDKHGAVNKRAAYSLVFGSVYEGDWDKVLNDWLIYCQVQCGINDSGPRQIWRNRNLGFINILLNSNPFEIGRTWVTCGRTRLKNSTQRFAFHSISRFFHSKCFIFLTCVQLLINECLPKVTLMLMRKPIRRWKQTLHIMISKT